jgi:hypothetical protein
MSKDLIDQERLKILMHYDPESGDLRWLNNELVYPPVRGKLIGCVSACGYLVVMINKRQYKAHRLAWLYVHGDHPLDMIDHINGDRKDNRIVNLRSVNNTVNQQNQRKPMSSNKSGFMGVCWHIRCRKWRVNLRHKGKTKHIGYFDDPQVGYQAYLSAKRELQEGCTI